jgi:hypothetical protein
MNKWEKNIFDDGNFTYLLVLIGTILLVLLSNSFIETLFSLAKIQRQSQFVVITYRRGQFLSELQWDAILFARKQGSTS